ncbi:MAG: ribonucleotide reductase N-terminal alpha domain-containing protein, partial [Candidatus Micrarchaeia archaeon]
MDSDLNGTHDGRNLISNEDNVNNTKYEDRKFVLKKVVKRTGEIQDFNSEKIKNAVLKAFDEVYPFKSEAENDEAATSITQKVMAELSLVNKEQLEIEKIQDIIEMILMKADPVVAKAFIIYRQKHAEQRAFRASLGIPYDNLKMPLNSLIVLAARYLLKDPNGKIIESPMQLFERVAKTVANAEKNFGKSDTEINDIKKQFYEVMTTFKFMPNSPTLMNAGTPNGQLSACFVLPVGDSLVEIYDAIKYAAIIQQSGGGTGFSFSRIRPYGDTVRSTSGIASGPITFMKVFNASTEAIKQGGKRRGANMGILRIDHPNILDFIVLKENEGVMQNFNLSVAVTDAFMKALKNNADYDLINPRNQQVVGRLNARAVWNLIITMAWKTGDPGIIFIDRINASYSNPVPKYGPIESTNPCVTGDTLMYTKEGLRRVVDLYNEGKEVDVKIDGRFGGGLSHASKVIKTGFKPVVRIKTEEGFSIKATRDHKFYSESRGWVEAGMLEPGEEIRVLNEKGAFGNSGSMAEGRLLGWLVGDGHINHGTGNDRAVLSFYGNDKTIAGVFEDYVNDVVRKPVNHHTYHVGLVYVDSRNMVSLSSKRLKEYAVSKGLGVEKLQVPEVVFRGSKEMQAGFLQGLFEADGTVNIAGKSRRSVRLSSISEKLLQDVQMLLLNFGIYSRIYLNRKDAGFKVLPGPDRMPKTYATKPYHDLVITGEGLLTFAEQIGFISDRKNSALLSAVNGYTKGPYTERYVARVSLIEEAGEEEVYDIIEPKTHSFIANGMVVHNCGEQPLYPYDSCNLGSINLAKMVKRVDHHFEVDWDDLRRVVRIAVRFLDNIVEVNKYPIPQIDKMSKSIRRIGLGIMGWADMLIKLGIRYDSNEALMLAENVMKFINDNARKASQELAVERGPFPDFNDSIWAKLGFPPLRNSTLTTLAPTGSISIIAGGSSQGIEPIFSVVYLRNVRESLGSSLLEVNNEFEALAVENNFYSEELMQKLAGLTSIQDVEEIPANIRKLFVTAHDIAPEWHVKMQAAFQKYTDSAVSKTINFPNWATPQDIEKAYNLA